MSTSLSERVAYLREASGRDAAPLSRLCGLASSHLGMIERGDVANLAEKTLRAIADVTGANLPWLAFGIGDAPEREAVRAAVDGAEARTVTVEDFTPSTPPEVAA